MDDSEAKYLIDQFNKFSSWFLKGFEPNYSLMAVGVAIAALLVIVFNTLNLLQLYPDVGKFIYGAISVLLIAALLVIMRFTVIMTQEHERNTKRLIALENYRSKHKSLPDTLTLETIVNRTPQQLEKLLANSEPDRSS